MKKKKSSRMSPKDISVDISDTAQKIGKDWFGAVIKRDIPRPPDETPKKEENERKEDEKTE